ncbi:MAG TPA: alpha/beta hydrolase [Caulobacteraceae bacterium]|nr:alpha/beta hydrolase [Caulobacteraceae bacterium]
MRWIGWGLLGLVVLLAAGWLALQRPDIPFATLKARYANAQSRWMDLPGGLSVHYRDEGLRTGPPIVLVHGFSASLQAWEPWVARLGDRYRIVSLDLPGHGLTEAPKGYPASIDGNAEIVDQVARRLGLGPYVVAGNSMGGAVAWDLALRHPDRLRGLVLVDAAGWPVRTGRSGPPPLIFALMGNPVGRLLVRDLDTRALAEKGLRSAYVDQRLVTPALVDRYVNLSRAPGHRDILLAIDNRPAAGPVTPATFAAIRVPTLVMHGEQDALIPLAAGRAFAAAIRGAKLITYPGVGHVPMEQIPDRSAADLTAFLEALPPSNPGPDESPK